MQKYCSCISRVFYPFFCKFLRKEEGIVPIVETLETTSLWGVDLALVKAWTMLSLKGLTKTKVQTELKNGSQLRNPIKVEAAFGMSILRRPHAQIVRIGPTAPTNGIIV